MKCNHPIFAYLHSRNGKRRAIVELLEIHSAVGPQTFESRGEWASWVAKLTAACPDGIDVYFENVGGAIWQAVLPLLNKFARVPVSGLVAQYNSVGNGDGTDRLPATMREILSNRITVRGFINYDFAEQHYAEFLREVCAGIVDGRIRYREDFVDGLENAPEAFIGMLEGRNFGKLIVRVGA